jgi:hypothetical protein
VLDPDQTVVFGKWNKINLKRCSVLIRRRLSISLALFDLLTERIIVTAGTMVLAALPPAIF